MNYQQLIESMSPDIYRRLQLAVELGKWPDGRKLSVEQRETCLQAMIAWSSQHLPPEEQPGYIDKGHKAGDSCDEPETTPLNWRD